MFHGGGGVLPILFSILSGVISVVAAAIVFLVVLGVLFLLVRFLWFGTRAAQVYLVKNGEPGHFTWPLRPVDDPEARSDAPRQEPAEPSDEPSTATAETTPLPENAAQVPPPRAPRKPKTRPAS